ncbi:hypothetical protein DIE06_03080 [Burkholderia sp. Bp8998]|nr:hypothetical protein DIE06_03080 [Burkholderia sp. Bp8998]
MRDCTGTVPVALASRERPCGHVMHGGHAALREEAGDTVGSAAIGDALPLRGIRDQRGRSGMTGRRAARVDMAVSFVTTL